MRVTYWPQICSNVLATDMSQCNGHGYVQMYWPQISLDILAKDMNSSTPDKVANRSCLAQAPALTMSQHHVTMLNADPEHLHTQPQICLLTLDNGQHNSWTAALVTDMVITINFSGSCLSGICIVHKPRKSGLNNGTVNSVSNC